MPKTNTWATYRFQPAVVDVCGGHATSVPVDCRMSGWPQFMTGRAWTLSVLFVPTGKFASTIRC